MSTKSILTTVAIIFISIALLSSCFTHKYSKTSIPDVRKVDRFDGDKHIGTFYQKHDDETGGWFEAEKNDAGEWDFTAKGKRDKDDELKIQQSAGGGNGGGGGGY
jgi:hypothetical protein